MSALRIVDAFPDFLAFWRENHGKPVETQIDGWAAAHGERWAELLRKQEENYAKESIDWRQIARERVFPHLGARLAAMQAAHDNLLWQLESVFRRAEQKLDLATDVVAVLYVGLGCGAGWATTYAGLPAVLFGLEMIAECGWSAAPALTGLAAHELSHIAHEQWRRAAQRAAGSGPLWDLYEEGFAQRGEHVILGQDTWHECTGINDDAWLDWCHERKAWLAAEFLRVVDARESVRPFFGSWYAIEGRRQCGYFLGHEVIKEFERRMSLREIAAIDDIAEPVRRTLQDFTRGGRERAASSEIFIREAETSDAAVLAALNREFNDDASPAADIAAQLQSGRWQETVLLAEAAGKVAGFACVRLFRSVCYSRPWAELSELYVQTPYRRRGIGRALVGAAERAAREKGATHMVVHTGVANVAGRSLYEGMGYREQAHLTLQKTLHSGAK